MGPKSLARNGLCSTSDFKRVNGSTIIDPSKYQHSLTLAPLNFQKPSKN